MPLLLSSNAIIEKNKLSASGAWLVLLEIKLPEKFLTTKQEYFHTEDDLYIRVVADTRAHNWPKTDTYTGPEFQPFPFELDSIGETRKGEVPSTQLRISNVSRAAQPFIEYGDGGLGATVKIMCVHSDHMGVVEDDGETGIPEVLFEFNCSGCKVTNKWITFKLGAINQYNKRFPQNAAYKNICRFRFKDERCAYSGTDATCGKTLTDCRLKGNSSRFGGFPGIGHGSIRV